MEAAAGVAASQSNSLPMPSPSRIEWRSVSDNHVVQNPGNDVGLELDTSKLGQHGGEAVDSNFFRIMVDGTLDDDLLQQRIQDLAKQGEVLRRMDIELRARAVARPTILEMQRSCDVKIKAHANTAAKLEEQLSECKQTLHQLEKKMEEKDRELQAIKVEKEEVWGKEDLLREQNRELATFRREHDHSEVEKAQHVKQINGLQEHIKEKERQIIELQERCRVAQEAIVYKDEQLKEAQTWLSRAQEMNALHSSTNHTLQAELGERTEQYNQLWHGCQRQFAEMERLHLHKVHQLQLALANARERNGNYTDESHVSNSKDLPQYVQNNGKQVDSNGSGATNADTGVISNGASDNVQPFAGNASNLNHNDLVRSVLVAPHGVPTYPPPEQVTALHSFVMHQQGVPQSVASHVIPYSVPAISSIQQWQNQQTSLGVFQQSGQNQLPPSQTEQSLRRSDVSNECEMSVDGPAICPDHLDHISQGSEPNSAISSSSGKAQVSLQFHDALKLSSLEQSSESQEQSMLNSKNYALEDQDLTVEEVSTAASLSPNTSVQSVNSNETIIINGTGAVLPKKSATTVQNHTLMSDTSETALLDEKTLLACIVRTIPTGGRIRINSTLPNRLGKMLAPLHWHNYKKKYGKLDDFVANHRELFVIEGDYIQLREGAQEMIAATTAVAKVAAATAAMSPQSTILPSVAVTPIAQPNRLKKVIS